MKEGKLMDRGWVNIPMKIVKAAQQPAKLYVDDMIIAPPSSADVDYNPKIVLYMANGSPLKRKVGF